MRLYTIDCLQGTGFCAWSYDKPVNRSQIINHFDQFRQDELMEIPKKALTLQFIQDFWEVQINEYRGDL